VLAALAAGLRDTGRAAALRGSLQRRLDAEHAKTSPLRGLVGNTTTEDEDG
jgi:hypothetical protein